MILDSYVSQFNEASLELEEFAEGATEVTDCSELRDAGAAFISAKEDFEHILKKYGVKIG